MTTTHGEEKNAARGTVDALLALRGEFFVRAACRALTGATPDAVRLNRSLRLLLRGYPRREVLAQMALAEGVADGPLNDEVLRRRPSLPARLGARWLGSLRFVTGTEVMPVPPDTRTALTPVPRAYAEDELPQTRSGIVCVIPFYHGAAFIERALKSAFVQTVPADEVIVVNDGSSPEERAVLARLATQYPFRIVDKANGGQGSARNAGVAASRSPYIAFLDQDDYYLPRHHELLREAMQRQRGDCGWVYADLHEANDDGRVYLMGLVGSLSAHPKRSVPEMLARAMFILPSASLIRRDAFEAVAGFDERFTGYEDDDLFLRLFVAGWSNAFVPDCTTVWCIRGGSTSHGQLWRASQFRYIDKLFASFPDRPGLGRAYFADAVYPRFWRKVIWATVNACWWSTDARVESLNDLVRFQRMARARPSVPLREKAKLALAVVLLDLFGRVGAAPLMAMAALERSRRWRSRLGGG